MPVTKRVVETFEVVYDFDCKIEVDYSDLISIVETGLSVIKDTDAQKIVQNATVAPEYVTRSELERLAKNHGLVLTSYHHGDVYTMVDKLVKSSIEAPNLRACMAYTLLGAKIDAIKCLRSYNGMGLKEAKDAVELFEKLGTRVLITDIIKAVLMDTDRRCERLEAGTFDQVIENDRWLSGYTS
jgi:hypothetical protein